MEARNLTQENVNRLESQLKEMRQTNPDLIYRFFNQDEEPSPIEIQLAQIQSDLIDLKMKINMIFGDAVLINGRWNHLTLK